MRRHDLSTLRVVVVDDSAHMCKLLQLMLSAFDIRCPQAFVDGAEAMRAMQADPPDLLLCDWEMEPIDGLTLVRRIRHLENGDLAGMPIVMLTGNTDAAKIREARAAGVSHVIVKPVTPQALFDRIAWAVANPLGRPRDLQPACFDTGAGAGRAPAPMP
jgi:two-component system chemotaxis response regulator CheY